MNMTIQYNTSNIEEEEVRLQETINELVENTLGRFEDKITRLEVHLSDENGHKNGQNDKRCLLEARIAGMQPIAVTTQANTFAEAAKDAVGKLKNKLETVLGKLNN
jgi:ribosome-associated translation inhibitor RaiA